MTISNFMSLPGTFVVLIVDSLSLGYFGAKRRLASKQVDGSPVCRARPGYRIVDPLATPRYPFTFDERAKSGE
jgi:hypothetical protein